jgi:arylsulfatase A-like enzyme
LVHNEHPVYPVDQTHSSQLYAEKLAQMIRQHHQNPRYPNQPLFMYLALGAAHSPLQPTAVQQERCRSIVRTDLRQRFCGLVLSADEALGRVRQALEETDMWDDTLVVFASDNGGQPWEGGRNFPFRGTKFSAFEGGARVPALLRLPPRRFGE